MTHKIQTVTELSDILVGYRQTGKRVVLTNGCFDLLHIGHVRYLQEARNLGDVLVVGVNSDSSVRSLCKGDGRPIIPEIQRAEILAALGCVDFVVLFDESDPLELVKRLQPDVLVKGEDWQPKQIVGREVVEAQGGTVRTVPMVPGISTTRLIERIQSLGVNETTNSLPDPFEKQPGPHEHDKAKRSNST